MKKLYGTGVALVTPFLENGAIDYKSLKKLLIILPRAWIIMW
jgi:Dihydrodipicolinate synthase/N-acetylneuraminate lyase